MFRAIIAGRFWLLTLRARVIVGLGRDEKSQVSRREWMGGIEDKKKSKKVTPVTKESVRLEILNGSGKSRTRGLLKVKVQVTQLARLQAHLGTQDWRNGS